MYTVAIKISTKLLVCVRQRQMPTDSPGFVFFIECIMSIFSKLSLHNTRPRPPARQARLHPPIQKENGPKRCSKLEVKALAPLLR